jgi:hypothetical protein
VVNRFNVERSNIESIANRPDQWLWQAECESSLWQFVVTLIPGGQHELPFDFRNTDNLPTVWLCGFRALGASVHLSAGVSLR